MALSGRLLFRILYRSIYSLLYIILGGLLLITPGNAIERSLRNNQQYNVWIIAICYIVAVTFVCFTYAWRLYVNKTVLNSIPKTYMPIDKHDVSKAVHRMIHTGLNRSAVIAVEARPRARAEEGLQEVNGARRRSNLGFRKSKTIAEDLGIVLPTHGAVWGEVEHRGWSSPNHADLPNVEYTTVLLELPNLIEAKAISLAPPDQLSQSEPPVPDADAVDLLSRTADMDLRDYVGQLSGLGVLRMDDTVANFVALYEYGRFSTRPMSNLCFRELMRLFAELLRAVRPLDPEALDASIQARFGDCASLSSSPNRGRGQGQSQPSGLDGSQSQGSANRRGRGGEPSVRTWASSYHTALNDSGGKCVSSRASNGSFAQTRRPYPACPASSASLRSKSSWASMGTAGSSSVIRLATGDSNGSLPYVLLPEESGG